MIACSRHKMFEENISLVTSYVLKHHPPDGGFPVEDTEEYSWGSFGLWKACLTFEVDQGNKFSTYAYYCIRNAIINGFRQNSRLAPTIDPLEIDGKNCSSDDVHNPFQMVELILKEGNDEKPRDKVDRQMLVMYYLDDMTLEEVGKRFQVTKNRVRQRIGRAIKVIRQRYRSLFESDQNAQESFGI